MLMLMSYNKNILLIGGTSGIGKALLERLSTDHKVTKIFATYHRHKPDTNTTDKVVWLNMDVREEGSIKQAIADINRQTQHIDWVINTVGLLHTDTNQPEKAVRQLDAEFFLQNMALNALPSLLIAKHIKPLLKAGTPSELRPDIYATISARVGSISENELGGWYSYRMSKAALNMGMKTLSIEWQRTLKNVCVAVIQPGTVDTPLSKPFQANVAKAKLFTPDACARHLLKVLNELTVEDTGCFIDWAGKTIAW